MKTVVHAADDPKARFALVAPGAQATIAVAVAKHDQSDGDVKSVDVSLQVDGQTIDQTTLFFVGEAIDQEVRATLRCKPFAKLGWKPVVASVAFAVDSAGPPSSVRSPSRSCHACRHSAHWPR